MSFLTTARISTKPIGFGTWQLYVIEVLMVFFGLFAFYFIIPNINRLSSGLNQIEMSGYDFMFLGVFGIYGYRIATYIAIIRKGRMPQRIEWIVTLFGFAVAFTFIILGGWMLREYASFHGYQYCFTRSSRYPDWVFVRTNLPCPPEPTFQELLNN